MTTLPHLAQSPLMTKSASSLASLSAAPPPLKRLAARVRCLGPLGLSFSLFFAGGLQDILCSDRLKRAGTLRGFGAETLSYVAGSVRCL